jgi:hypothetical protein
MTPTEAGRRMLAVRSHSRLRRRGRPAGAKVRSLIGYFAPRIDSAAIGQDPRLTQTGR